MQDLEAVVPRDEASQEVDVAGEGGNLNRVIKDNCILLFLQARDVLQRDAELPRQDGAHKTNVTRCEEP